MVSATLIEVTEKLRMKWEGVLLTTRPRAAALEAAGSLLTRVEVLDGPSASLVYADGQNFDRTVREEPNAILVSDEVRAARRREAEQALASDQVVVSVAVRGLTQGGVKERRNRLITGAHERLGEPTTYMQ